MASSSHIVQHLPFPRQASLLHRSLSRVLWGGHFSVRQLLSSTGGDRGVNDGAKKRDAAWKGPSSAPSKKVDSKTGGGGGGDEEEKANDPLGDGSPEDWLAPRATLFVVIMFGVTAFFWYLSKPRGKAVGWATLKECVGEIELISVYDQYAQVYLSDGRKLYVGLVDSQHTASHVNELQQLYKEKKSQNMKQTPAKPTVGKGKQPELKEGGEVAAQQQLFKHDTLPVVVRGNPVSSSILAGVGVFAWMVPFVFFPIYVMILSRSITRSVSHVASVANQVQNKAKMTFKVEKPSSTRFRDVAGMKEPKGEITEIVDFLRSPQRYTALGAKIPTGALLLGPPGTGKTLIAKAVSGESGVSFIPVCGSDFVELYAGMGAKRVRKLFEVAKKQRCIIYIDEIDAVGLKRQGAGHGEKQEQEHTLNELLTQLDGFASGDRAGDVILLASSNVPLESLDPALVRPGRFDRIIHVDSPVRSERIDIFKVHLAKIKLVADKPKEGEEAEKAVPSIARKVEESGKKTEAESEGASSASVSSETSSTTTLAKEAVGGQAVTSKALVLVDGHSSTDSSAPSTSATTTSLAFDVSAVMQEKTEEERCLITSYAERMSDLCPGFVGSDIANVCNEAAILATQESCSHVYLQHLERSIDRVLAGVEHRSRVLSDFERNVVAHHEAGHAVAGWFLQRSSPLMKVSVVPRGGSALGYAQYLPNENHNTTARELRDSISVSLGGRIAEEIFFQHLSSGASDDLRKVRHMAYAYVGSFGLSGDGTGLAAVYSLPDSGELRYRKPYGHSKADQLDVMAKQLVDEIYKDTFALLLSHKADMKRLADHLLQHEVLTHSDVVHYLGPRPARDKDRKPLAHVMVVDKPTA